MTRLARKRFWVVKKSGPTVERLLLVCLSETDEPRAELISIIRTSSGHRQRIVRI